MTITADTRKPVEDLNSADLELFPIWQFVEDDGNENDDEDETWVRPAASSRIPANAMALCMAAAARLPCGLVYPAVLFGDTSSGVTVDGIALLTTGGRVLFHKTDSPAEIRTTLKRLGLSQAQVFPLEFATRAALSGTGAPAFGRFGG